MQFFKRGQLVSIFFIAILLGVATAEGGWFDDEVGPVTDTETIYTKIAGEEYLALDGSLQVAFHKIGKWEGSIGLQRQPVKGQWRFNSYGQLCLDGLDGPETVGPCSTIVAESDGALNWRGMWFKRIPKETGYDQNSSS